MTSLPGGPVSSPTPPSYPCRRGPWGDRCDASLIAARQLDWRTDLTVPFSAYPIDRDLERRLCATLRELGLAMGIFDVKLTDADEPVFLEVNAQGQFLFVEALCDIPLADTLAAFLVDQARQHVSSRTTHAAEGIAPHA